MVNLHFLNQTAAAVQSDGSNNIYNAQSRSSKFSKPSTSNENSLSSYFSFHNMPSNQLQLLLKKQDQQARVSNTNISSNFHIITQYILQSYFKVHFNELHSLRIVDLIVDQTYPDSITLRKLNENTSIKPYEYFNTIARDEDISRCPIFALAIYFVIRWSHPNPPISIENFDNIPLLDPNFISPNQSSGNILNNNGSSTTSTNRKISRSEVFEPSQDLIAMIFPWLSPLKQDMLLIDRTNYKLNSFVELFEFFAKTIIQDLRYLNHNSMLLPNIVSFVAKFIPDLFRNEQFKSPVAMTSTTMIMTTNDNNLFDNNNNNESNYTSDSHFLELSERLTTENIRLSQQINQLKSELNNVNAMCNQILQLQRQLLSGSSNSNANTNSNLNLSMNDNQNNFTSNNSGNGNGFIILDKNSINSSMLSNLVQSIEDTQQQQQQQQQLQQQQLQQADTPSLAPINMFQSLSNPMPSMFAAQQQQQQQQKQSTQPQDTNMKRKLPLPTSAPPSGTGPFSPSPGPVSTVPGNMDSPYSKRFRFDERPTPSQTALDSLLSKSIGSPRFPSLQGTNPNLNAANNGVSSRLPSRFTSPATFPMPVSPAAAIQSAPSNPTIPYGAGNTLQQQRDQQLDSYSSAPKQINDRPVFDGSNSTSAVEPAPADADADIAATSVRTSTSVDSIKNATDSIEADNAKSDSTASPTEKQVGEDDKSTSPKSSNEKENSSGSLKRNSQSGEKLGPNRHIKYKLSRENKTIWDLYTEWYIGLNGKPSIKNLIENYGWRRWKVSDDSHFFPTRRIIMDYIETECDRGIKLGRFTNPDQPREDIRKILVGDLEKFRINNGLTLNSLSMYFKNLTKENKEICIFENFKSWSVRGMTEDEKIKYCKRQHMKDSI